MGSVMTEGVINLHSRNEIIKMMKKQFERVPSDMLNDLESLFDDMIAIGRDTEVTLNQKQDMAQRLHRDHSNFDRGFISFHIQRFIQTPPEELSNMPDGEQLREEEISRREAATARKKEPRPWVRPKYGWGTRVDPETGEEVHWVGTHERFN